MKCRREISRWRLYPTLKRNDSDPFGHGPKVSGRGVVHPWGTPLPVVKSRGACLFLADCGANSNGRKKMRRWLSLMNKSSVQMAANFTAVILSDCATSAAPSSVAEPVAQLLWFPAGPFPLQLFSAPWSWSYTASWWWRQHSSVSPPYLEKAEKRL